MTDSNKENITPSKSQGESNSNNTEFDNPLKGYTSEEIMEQFAQLFTRFDKELDEAQIEKEKLRSENLQIDYELSKEISDMNLIKDILYRKELRLGNFQNRVKHSNKGLEMNFIQHMYDIEMLDELNFTLKMGEIIVKFGRKSTEEGFKLLGYFSGDEQIQSQLSIDEDPEELSLFLHANL